MQTLLPYPSFYVSALVLDRARLGKQRVEARQLYDNLVGEKDQPWIKRHPAFKMWVGYTDSLSVYHDVMIGVWIYKGHVNNMPKISIAAPWNRVDPPWLGDPAFHASHRSNLLRKDPKHYSKFGWSEPDNLEYVWPTKQKEPERCTLLHNYLKMPWN